MALGTIDTHSEWHHVRWSYPDSVQCLPICSIYSAHCDAHSSSTPRACDRTHRRSPLSLSIGSRKEICRSASRLSSSCLNLRSPYTLPALEKMRSTPLSKIWRTVRDTYKIGGLYVTVRRPHYPCVSFSVMIVQWLCTSS